jgi:hypothetical protein
MESVEVLPEPIPTEQAVVSLRRQPSTLLLPFSVQVSIPLPWFCFLLVDRAAVGYNTGLFTAVAAVRGIPALGLVRAILLGAGLETVLEQASANLMLSELRAAAVQ